VILDPRPGYHWLSICTTYLQLVKLLQLRLRITPTIRVLATSYQLESHDFLPLFATQPLRPEFVVSLRHLESSSEYRWAYDNECREGYRWARLTRFAMQECSLIMCLVECGTMRKHLRCSVGVLGRMGYYGMVVTPAVRDVASHFL